LDYVSNIEVELEELLKLLKETEVVKENHPFLLFMKENNMQPGTKLVKIDHLIRIYRNQTGRRINVTKALKALEGHYNYQGKRGIPYIKVDRIIKGVYKRKKKQRVKTKKA